MVDRLAYGLPVLRNLANGYAVNLLVTAFDIAVMDDDNHFEFRRM